MCGATRCGVKGLAPETPLHTSRWTDAGKPLPPCHLSHLRVLLQEGGWQVGGGWPLYSPPYDIGLVLTPCQQVHLLNRDTRIETLFSSEAKGFTDMGNVFRLRCVSGSRAGKHARRHNKYQCVKQRVCWEEVRDRGAAGLLATHLLCLQDGAHPHGDGAAGDILLAKKGAGRVHTCDLGEHDQAGAAATGGAGLVEPDVTCVANAQDLGGEG